MRVRKDAWLTWQPILTLAPPQRLTFAAASGSCVALCPTSTGLSMALIADAIRHSPREGIVGTKAKLYISRPIP